MRRGHTPPCTASAGRITVDESAITVTYHDRETKRRVERVGELRSCVLVLDAFRMRNAKEILIARIGAIASAGRTGSLPATPITAVYPTDPQARRRAQATALRNGADTLSELGEEIAAALLRARAAAVTSGFQAVPNGLSFIVSDAHDDDAPTIVRTILP